MVEGPGDAILTGANRPRSRGIVAKISCRSARDLVSTAHGLCRIAGKRTLLRVRSSYEAGQSGAEPVNWRQGVSHPARRTRSHMGQHCGTKRMSSSGSQGECRLEKGQFSAALANPYSQEITPSAGRQVAGRMS